MKRVVVAFFILTAITATALAADIEGKWTGSSKGITLTFTFKQDGAKLTGMVRASTGESVAISDGRVEGDKLSFTVYLDEGRSLRLLNTGVVIGDEIELNATTGGVGFSGGGSMTLRRDL